MHVIAHWGCTDTVRESAPKVDFGRKIPCHIRASNLPQRHASLMCLPTELHSHPNNNNNNHLIMIIMCSFLWHFSFGAEGITWDKRYIYILKSKTKNGSSVAHVYCWGSFVTEESQQTRFASTELKGESPVWFWMHEEMEQMWRQSNHCLILGIGNASPNMRVVKTARDTGVWCLDRRYHPNVSECKSALQTEMVVLHTLRVLGSLFLFF